MKKVSILGILAVVVLMYSVNTMAVETNYASYPGTMCFDKNHSLSSKWASAIYNSSSSDTKYAACPLPILRWVGDVWVRTQYINGAEDVILRAADWDGFGGWHYYGTLYNEGNYYVYKFTDDFNHDSRTGMGLWVKMEPGDIVTGYTARYHTN